MRARRARRVEKAHIIDGRKHHAILLELLTDEAWHMIKRS